MYVEMDIPSTDSLIGNDEPSVKENRDDDKSPPRRTIPNKQNEIAEINRAALQQGEEIWITAQKMSKTILRVWKKNGGTLRGQKIPKQFTIHKLKKTSKVNELTVREALITSIAPNGITAMREELNIFEGIDCWKKVNRSRAKKIPHSNFVLRRKRHHTGKMKKYKAKIVVFGNEEHVYEDECFSSVPVF